MLYGALLPMKVKVRFLAHLSAHIPSQYLIKDLDDRSCPGYDVQVRRFMLLYEATFVWG